MGASQAFTSTTYDQYSNARSGDTVAWSVANAAAGSINASSGVFTAGTVAGTYTNAVVATSGAVTGNASVTVTPGPLAGISITPRDPSVTVGTSLQLTATSYDAYGNIRTGDPIGWYTPGGGTVDSTGLFTAGTSAPLNTEVWAVLGTVHDVVYLSVVAGPLHHIAINPPSASVTAGSGFHSQMFTASFSDVYGNWRPIEPYSWSVTNPAAGWINWGDFYAGTVAGSYPDVVVLTSGTFTATASVTVTPAALHHITVSPSHPTLPIGTTQSFSAAGYDQYDNARAGMDVFAWSVTDPLAGTINASTGLFTATSNAANATDYSNVIQATSGEITGTASVNVVAGIINGTVTLQGGLRSAAGRTIPLTIKLFTVDPARSNTDFYNGAGALTTYTPTSVNGGTNTVAFQIVGLAPGSYDITIVAGHTLMNVKKNVAVSGPTGVDFGTLLEGNCNNDLQVTAIDFSILAASYLKGTGQAGFDSRADFDYSGQVTSVDFSLLAVNYLKSVQTVPTP